MAPQPQESSDAETLIRRIEASRSALAVRAHGVREKLNVPRRVKESALRHPLTLFGASLGTGFIASRIIARPRKKKTKEKKSGSGMIGFIAASAFAAARPLLLKFVAAEAKRRFADYAEKRFPARTTRIPLSED